ncbi:MAG: MATE family efflux transporter [Gammaproteobacteria bacterium]|nr:MATE family efflux transporter [Gammaproteobacteria bacterium]
MKNKFGFSELSARIMALALPMTTVQFISASSTFFCMMMLAHLGHQVLAASALISASQMPVIMIGTSLLFVLSFLVGHAYGGKNYILIGSYIQQAWLYGLIVSIPMLFIFWNMGSILTFFHQPAPQVQLVTCFYKAFVWAVLPLVLLMSNQQLCYGTQHQKIAMLSSLLSVVVLVVSAYILIFGKFGAPALGVEGLGYAIAVQCWFGFSFTMLCFCRMEGFKKFELFNYRIHKNWHCLRQMLKVGWPVSVQIGGELLSFFATAIMVGWLGATELGAFQVVNQYILLVIIPIFALSQSVGVLVGQARGAKQFHEIKLIGTAAIKVTLAVTLVVAIVFLVFPRNLAALYLDASHSEGAQIMHLIIILFAIMAFARIFDAIRNVMTGALRGLFDTKYPMYVGLIVIWLIGIPLGYVLAFPLHLGLAGIATGSLIGMGIGAVLLLFRWHKLSNAVLD